MTCNGQHSGVCYDPLCYNRHNGFASRVAARTKHGPAGSGNDGPCDAECVKCEAERIVALGQPDLKMSLKETSIWQDIRTRLLSLLETEPDLELRSRLLGQMEEHWQHQVPRQAEFAALEHRCRAAEAECRRRGEALRAINHNLAELRKTMVY